MPRGVPKSASATSVPAASTRSASARSAKIKANMSLMDHKDADYDQLIRKHDKKGARGFAKVRETTTGAKRAETASPADAEAEAIVKRSQRAKDDEGADAAPAKRKAKQMNKDIESEKDSRQPHDDDVDMQIQGQTAAGSDQKAHATSSNKSEEESAPASSMSMKTTAGKRSGKTKASTSKSAKKASKETQSQTQKTGEEKVQVLGTLKTANVNPHGHSEEHSVKPAKGKGKAVDTQLQGKENASPERKRNIEASSPGKHKRAGPITATSKPFAPAMSENQIQSFLANYDLEAENRIRIAVKTLQISLDSARTQMHAKAIAKLPRGVRLMRMGDFVHEYGADVKAALERGAVTANRAREGEWEEEKLQRKRKGDDASGIDGDGRRKDKNPKTEAAQTNASSAASAQQRRAKGKAAIASASRKVAAPVSRVPVLSPSREASSVRPPTAQSFAPRLRNAPQAAVPQNVVATPARGPPRAAQTGEQIQYMSLNGSPIIGVIGPDGTVHAIPKTVGTPSSDKRGVRPDVPDDDDQDAAETSAHLLELAKGIDGQQKRSRTHLTSGDSSSSQSSAMHTAPGTRSNTFDNESDDGGDVFEEAHSLPEDDASSLPDEEAYTAQVLREEAARRERARASNPAGARSSASNFAGRSSSGSGNASVGAISTARNSASTIRPSSAGRKGALSSVTSSGVGGQVPSSSPMIKSKFQKSTGTNLWRPAPGTAGASSSSSSSAPAPSSPPKKGRVSIVFGSGSQQRVTHLGVEDLMRLPSHERTQMLQILEKLRRSQLASSE